MNYILPFSASFLLAAVLTYLAKNIGQRFGVLSKPRPRDIHKKPVPRIGGPAIFLAFLLVSLVVYLYAYPNLSFGPGQWLGVDKHIVGIWLGGLMIAGTMLVDDIKGLKAWQKLFAQVLVTLILIAAGVGIDRLSVPFGGSVDLNSVYIPIMKYQGITYHFSLWSDLLTLVWVVGMMNILNFIDGVDGLASGIATIAAIVVFSLSLHPDVSQPATALLSIITAGAAAGFLVWNFPPAKIFMGDSGSMFLGYILAVLAIISGGKLATAFLVVGFFIIDGILVAGGRLLRRENPFTTPDKTHLHHRFLNAGFSARQAVVSLYLIAAGFGIMALQLQTMTKVIAAMVLMVLLLAVIKLLNMAAGKKTVE